MAPKIADKKIIADLKKNNMKKNLTLGIIGWLIATLGSYKAVAQDGYTVTPDGKKETQEVIIRKKGDKDTKVTVEITGDKILINGKPLAEFNEDGVTINNRKMIIRDGNKITMDFDGKMMDLDSKLEELKGMKDFQFRFDDNNMDFGEAKAYTYMGVNTEKADDGVKIISVSEESPASKAGLQKDDIIYKIDDTKISTIGELSETIRAKKDGDKVKVYYRRDGKKKDVKITVATMKNTMAKTFSFSTPEGGMKSLTIPRTPRMPRTPGTPRLYNDDGMGLENDMQIFRRQKLGIKIQDTEDATGVKVLDVDASSAAATAGLMKDDVITEIAGNKVTNTDEAREQLAANAEKTTYTVKAKRNGSEMTFNIKIPKNLKTANL